MPFQILNFDCQLFACSIDLIFNSSLDKHNNSWPACVLGFNVSFYLTFIKTWNKHLWIFILNHTDLIALINPFWSSQATYCDSWSTKLKLITCFPLLAIKYAFLLTLKPSR